MKESVRDLAVFGGRPAFDAPLHVGQPHVGDRANLRARLDDQLDRRWLTNHGRYVAELEQRIADYVGVAHCIATSSGTTALQIAARAARLSGEVVVPSFTFVATAHALAWQGLEPVFCDVEPETHNISPTAAADVLGSRTSGIVGVHLWGRACDVSALTDLARARDLKLIFDASHAFGCSRGGRLIGGNGDAEIFSFHATKVLNAGEGGAIVTNEPELAESCQLLRNFGFAGYDDVVSLGINGKMSEMAAAMALTSLESIDRFIDANRRNHDAYEAGLRELPDLTLIDFGAEVHTHQHAVVELDARQSRLSRDQLHQILWSENVLARRYFRPGVHRMQPYAGRGEVPALPATEALSESILVLPNGGILSEPEVASVCELIRFSIAHADEIRDLLPERNGRPEP